MRPVIIPLLALPVGLLSLLLGGFHSSESLRPSGLATTPLQAHWESPWLAGLTAPDPALDAILATYLAGLERHGWASDQQGIWLQAGNQAIAQHLGNQLLPAASLTKLATSLATLQTWSPNHQFETLVGLNGPVQNGVLQGDLVVRGGGDPLFVWEEAIALANALQQMGLRQVTGDLVVTDNFTMNFEARPSDSVAALALALNSSQWTGAVRQAYDHLPPGTRQPQIQIDGVARLGTPEEANGIRWILRHQSLPLVGVLKAMNVYSNNAMADMLAKLVGGPNAVIDLDRQATDLPPGEISLDTGSGLGMENQMSPRTVVALLAALQDILADQGYSIADILPVAGEDVGTLIDRRIPDTAAVKTGSLAEVSALAGVLPTADQGPVWFAILNRGWDISDLRVQQDLLLQAIQSHWGVATVPPALTAKVRLHQGAYQFGDPQRNQRLGSGLE